MRILLMVFFVIVWAIAMNSAHYAITGDVPHIFTSFMYGILGGLIIGEVFSNV